MSQNISRQPQLSKHETNNYFRYQFAKNKHQNIPRKVHQTLVSEDQLKASRSSVFLKGTLDNNPVNGSVGDAEFTNLSLSAGSPSACQSPDALLAHKSLNASRGCTGDVSMKTHTYAACSQKKSSVNSNALCETGTQNRTHKYEGNRSNERNVSTFGKGDKHIFCHRELVTNVVATGNEKNVPYPSNFVITQNRNSTVSNQISKLPKKVCESKSFQLNSDYQRVFKRDLHPKLLSKKLGLTCLQPVRNAIDISSSLSPDTQKSRSSISINHSSSVNAWNQPFELNMSTPNSDLSDNGQNNSAQPEIKFFDYVDHRKKNEADRKGKNNYLVSQSAHNGIIHGNTFSASTNQDHQKHLQVSAKNNNTTWKSGKIQQIQQIFTPQKHQDTKDNTQYIRHNQNGDTRKLLKYDKPYRQWYRVSRVVAAESKFIISPDNSSHCSSDPENETSLLEKKTELSTLNEHYNQHLTKMCILKEPAKCSLISMSNPDSCGRENMCDGPKSETSNETRISQSAESLYSTEKNQKNNIQAEKRVSMSSTTLIALPINGEDPAVSHVECEELNIKALDGNILCGMPIDSSERNITLTDSRFNNTKVSNSDRVDRKETAEDKAFKIHDFRTTGASVPVVSSSQSQRKSSLKVFCLAKLQNRKKHLEKQITETGSSCVHRQGCEYIQGDTIHAFKPLNLVTGVSKITGPAREDKGQVFLDHTIMATSTTKGLVQKIVNKNPCLDESSRQVPGRINKISNLNSLTVHQSDLTTDCITKSKSYSRTSRHISRSSSDVNSRPANARSKHMCHPARSVYGTVTSGRNKEDHGCLKRKSNIGREVPEEKQRQPLLQTPKSGKLFFTDVASKFLQKVNRVGLRVHWSESTANVKTSSDLREQRKIRNRQKVKQQSSLCELSNNISYDHLQADTLKKRKHTKRSYSTILSHNDKVVNTNALTK